jgi:hypothetical protein
MASELTVRNQVLISISVIFGAIALALACIGIGTANWQTTQGNTTSGQSYISSTANFFYACNYTTTGDVVNCASRTINSDIQQYYLNISNKTGSQAAWSTHLNTAAGFYIIVIIFILIVTITTLFMFIGDRAEWIFLVAPSYLFLACLFMLAGLAEGSRILLYNGYSANLYETAHLLTIFSFLISSIVAGRLFRNPPVNMKPSKTITRKY